MWYRSEIPTHFERFHLLLKFRFCVEFFDFRVSVIAPYWEPTTGRMQMLFWWKNFEDGNCPSPGLFAAP
jgi:hypothetical protein